MASAVHIPIEELSSETRSLLERADASDIVVDGKGVRFKISRLPSRTTAEALELVKNSANADVEVDEGWSKDMAEIIALRRTEPYRDPWA